MSSADDDVTAETKQVFASVSEGKDSISKAQFYVLASKLGADMSVKKLDAAFTSLDKDGSGAIDYDEFNAWWSDNSSNKSMLSSMRNALQKAQGYKLLAQKFSQKSQAASGKAPASLTVYGDGKHPEMIILARVDDKAPEGVSFTDNQAEKFATISVQITSTPQSAPLLAKLALSVFSFTELTSDGDGMSLTVDDNKDGTLQFNCTLPDTGDFKFLNDDLMGQLNGFIASINFGWSWAWLEKNYDKFQLLDLIKIKIEAALGNLPIPAEVYSAGLEQLNDLLPPPGSLPVDVNLDAFDGLKNGDLSAQINLSSIIDQGLQFASMMSPLPFQDAAVVSLVPSALELMEVKGDSETTKLLKVINANVDSVGDLINRDLISIDGIHMTRLTSSKQTAALHLEFNNVFDLKGLFAFLRKVLATAEKSLEQQA